MLFLDACNSKALVGIIIFSTLSIKVSYGLYYKGFKKLDTTNSNRLGKADYQLS
jgi:hypothetical protein